MKTTKELLVARVKELRKARGLSQEQLAEMIEIEPKHVSRIEVVKSYPTLDRLERIAKALDVPMSVSRQKISHYFISSKQYIYHTTYHTFRI